VGGEYDTAESDATGPAVRTGQFCNVADRIERLPRPELPSRAAFRPRRERSAIRHVTISTATRHAGGQIS